MELQTLWFSIAPEERFSMKLANTGIWPESQRPLTVGTQTGLKTSGAVQLQEVIYPGGKMCFLC